MPFQVWLPRGYWAAPGPARAIMAGVAVNVGFYGLWRTLALLGPPPAAATDVLLILAAMTALLGIAHAAVQTSLQRVIAYSSVENTGLILAGFGVALVGAATRDRGLLAAGLLAATLQIIAHTFAKSLLFVSSARIHGPDGSDDLDGLRGSVRRTPWSGTGLAIGSLTLAGLPPTAGFVSEWFLLESLMQQFRVADLSDRLVLAVTGAAVALTAGFAGVTFVRLVGLVVLGKPLRGGRRRRDDYGLGGRAGVAALSVACLAIAAVTPLEVRVIAAGLSPVLPASAVLGALKSPWVLQPVFGGFSILSPSWLWLAMPVLFGVVAVGAWALSGRRLLRVRRVPPWLSATAGVAGPDSYTAFGFANPTRRVLASVLHTKMEVRRIETRDGQPPGRIRRACRLPLRRHRGGRTVSVPAVPASVPGRRAAGQAAAVRAPGCLSCLHAARPGRSDRRRHSCALAQARRAVGRRCGPHATASGARPPSLPRSPRWSPAPGRP